MRPGDRSAYSDLNIVEYIQIAIIMVAHQFIVVTVIT